MVSFGDTEDNGLTTEGLNFFIGQELRLEPGLLADRDSALRLGIRLISQLVLSGAVQTPDQIIGPDGIPLRLEPSRDGSVVAVSRG